MRTHSVLLVNGFDWLFIERWERLKRSSSVISR